MFGKICDGNLYYKAEDGRLASNLRSASEDKSFES